MSLLFRCQTCGAIMCGVPPAIPGYGVLATRACGLCGDFTFTQAWSADNEWQSQVIPSGYTNEIELPIPDTSGYAFCGVADGLWAILRDDGVWFSGELPTGEYSEEIEGASAVLACKSRVLIGDALPFFGRKEIVRPLPTSPMIEMERERLGLGHDAISRALVHMLAGAP